jgi:type IV secretory pathway VirB2 component (pilin)
MSPRRITRYLPVLVVTLASSTAFASGGDSMPWEGPLTKIVNSLTGPVAKAVGVVAIIVAGLGMAMGEGGSGVKSLLRIVFALAIVFTASTFIVSFFGASSGFAP